MITFIETKSNEKWSSDLPLWQNENIHTFKPSEGLNILFGPNGCGKTTLLKAIARFCMLDVGKPFSSYTQTHITPTDLRRDSRQQDRKEACEWYRKHPKGIDINCDWNGSATYWVGPDVYNRNLYHTDQIANRPGGFETYFSLTKASEGENAAILAQTIIRGIGKESCIKPLPTKGYNEAWTPCIEHFNNLVPDVNDGKTRYPILLADEPDRSLAFPIQVQLFESLRNFAHREKVQMFVATHSIAAIAYADCVLEFVDGSVKSVTEALNKVSTQIKSP